MKARMNVLVAGRNAQELQELERILEHQTDLRLSTRLITNGHSDPLYNIVDLPDALIFCTTVAWEDELSSLDARPASGRVPTVVTGPDNTQVMRTAMRVGARDYFSFPVPRQELVDSLDRIARELQPASTEAGGLISVINAKGGSGASTVAATLAHSLVEKIDQQVALLDMDLQFGHLASYFDLPEAGGLVDAILRADSMDRLALEGHMMKHKSGLHLLGNSSDQLLVPGDIDENQLHKLLALLRSRYEHTVVDLPRQIDGVTGLLLESSERVLLVLQQSICHVQDARRMLHYMRHYMGIADERIGVVVNRWDKRLALTIGDIEKALGIDGVTCIPNDFAKVAESANLGIPLLEVAPASPVSRSMVRLAEDLSGKKTVTAQSGFGRVWRKLAGA
ncbi:MULTISPECIES: AAA family ATPase [Marinobacter]|uniref:Pilus assembly protein CpaF n=1 Tax=Marinobacter profundi TaxID=2666256 RepID=A0A2G1UQA9_9GAMM|nr:MULTISPECIES: AAA family ATPase [Marinobacter]MBD3656830.1 AAA family ATPase [Marinobacter sp.]PHQ16691.1 pilus assembly protein CpaF [Marinobacter profundi]